MCNAFINELMHSCVTGIIINMIHYSLYLLSSTFPSKIKFHMYTHFSFTLKRTLFAQLVVA